MAADAPPGVNVRCRPGEDAGRAAGAPLGVDAIVAAVGAVDAVLDLGCGGGRLTIELARAGARATGIDTHAGRLGQARDRARAAGVQIGLIEADMNVQLPFADAAFAAVT
ncbi:MAG TPA: class I SAM-dependent methyltransferase, partial [Gaiellales bacterium]